MSGDNGLTGSDDELNATNAGQQADPPTTPKLIGRMGGSIVFIVRAAALWLVFLVLSTGVSLFIRSGPYYDYEEGPRNFTLSLYRNFLNTVIEFPRTFMYLMPVLVVGYLLWRRSFSVRKLDPPAIPTLDLDKYVRNIFESDDFLTTLRSTLPRGKEDEKFGLDFIPYMLHSINERRERLEKSSKVFLSLTIILGLLFSGVLIYFGYILLNEAAAGVPRTLANIEEETRSIKAQLEVVVPRLSENAAFKIMSLRTLEALRSAPPGNNRTIADEINKAISKALAEGDILPLRTKLAEESNRINKDGDTEAKYEQIFSKATEDLNSFWDRKESAAYRLSNHVAELDKVIKEADTVSQRPENRIAEVIKRLALGFVVATFFLAILRYLGGLYRDHYRQALLAELDDLAIRRFYVAYKCSSDSNETRKGVVTAFMRGAFGHASTEISEDGKSEGVPYDKVLQELISLLAKKM